MHTYQVREKPIVTNPLAQEAEEDSSDVSYVNPRQSHAAVRAAPRFEVSDVAEWWTGSDNILAQKFPARKVVGYLSAS